VKLASVAGYALGAIGVGVMGMAVAKTLATNLEYVPARTMLINLLRTNPNRAEILCKSMSGTFFEAVGSAIKTGAMCKTNDPTILASATRPAYDGIAMAVTAKWNQLLGKAKLAGMMLGGGLMMGLSTGTTPILLLVLCAIAGLMAIWLVVAKGRVDRSIVLARHEVLPEVDRAFVEGRYILQQ
jgi:hypothetical protein